MLKSSNQKQKPPRVWWFFYGFVFGVCLFICNFVPTNSLLQNREYWFDPPSFRLDNKGDCVVGRNMEDYSSFHMDANLDNTHSDNCLSSSFSLPPFSVYDAFRFL